MSEKTELGQREDGFCFIHGGYIGLRCKQCWPDNDPRLSAQYKSNPANAGEPSSAPPAKPTLAVGVSVLITIRGKMLLGKRKNNTAEGLYSTPGGRIELNEDMFACAIRETREETGIDLYRSNLEVIGFKEHFRFGQHYVMFYIHALGFEGVAKNLEPDKCEGWEWHDITSVPKNCTEPEEIINKLRSGAAQEVSPPSGKEE